MVFNLVRGWKHWKVKCGYHHNLFVYKSKVSFFSFKIWTVGEDFSAFNNFLQLLLLPTTLTLLLVCCPYPKNCEGFGSYLATTPFCCSTYEVKTTVKTISFPLKESLSSKPTDFWPLWELRTRLLVLVFDARISLFIYLYCLQEEKDLRMKADMVKRLMERGYRVKVLFFHLTKWLIISVLFSFLFLFRGQWLFVCVFFQYKIATKGLP